MRRNKHHGTVNARADARYTSGSEAVTLTKVPHSKPTPSKCTPPKPTPRPPPKPNAKVSSTQAPKSPMAPPTACMEFRPNPSYGNQVFYDDCNMYEELDMTRGEEQQSGEYECM